MKWKSRPGRASATLASIATAHSLLQITISCRAGNKRLDRIDLYCDHHLKMDRRPTTELDIPPEISAWPSLTRSQRFSARASVACSLQPQMKSPSQRRNVAGAKSLDRMRKRRHLGVAGPRGRNSATNAFSGRIAMVMGAKNMTMTEVQRPPDRRVQPSETRIGTAVLNSKPPHSDRMSKVRWPNGGHHRRTKSASNNR